LDEDVNRSLPDLQLRHSTGAQLAECHRRFQPESTAHHGKITGFCVRSGVQAIRVVIELNGVATGEQDGS
jgi:hypothetical protein